MSSSSRSGMAQASVAGAADLWNQVSRARLELVCFPLVFGVYLLHLFLTGYDRFYYDAQDYWNQGQSFERNGHFSLVAYSDPFRGYSLPLLYHALQAVASNAGLGS